MKLAVDYRKFRLNKLNTPEFSHLKLLLFWPLFGLCFLTVERLWIRESYTAIHCALDDVVPFCEFFIIPYMFWFLFMVGPLLYTFLYDIDAFKRMMKFIIVSFSIAMITYMIFPNCQNLRPAAFERDNIFTRFMVNFYRFDTNTNVCPSLHVIGSVAGLVGMWRARGLKTPLWRTFALIMTVLISLSTVFLKQHSTVDVMAAVPVCIIAYLFVRFTDKPQKNKV